MLNSNEILGSQQIHWSQQSSWIKIVNIRTKGTGPFKENPHILMIHHNNANIAEPICVISHVMAL